MKIKIILFLFLFLPAIIFSRVRLPKLISNGLVLQRDADIKIWGWAMPGEVQPKKLPLPNTGMAVAVDIGE